MTCKWKEECAYKHSVHWNQTYIHNLEDDIKDLKEDVHLLYNHIKVMTQHNKKEIQKIKEQHVHLSNNLSAMMAKFFAIDL